MNRFFRAWFSFLVIFLLTTVSCTQDQICLSNQHALQAGFYSAWTESDKDSLLIDASVFGIGDGIDSIYKNEIVTKMFLPLSFDRDTTGFVIKNHNLVDTIWFKHSKEIKFISRDCGFTFNFTIDTTWFTNIFIDSVAIGHPLVNYGEDIENIKIYLY